MSDTSSAPQHLAQSQAVIDRLQALTTPFASADKGLREHLLAAWLEKLQALRELGRHAEGAQAADALAQHLEGSAPEDWHWLAQALFHKGMAQARHGDYDEALATWRALAQRFEQTESAQVREWLVRAGYETIALTVYRGATFARVDMVREADRLEEKFGKDEWPATQQQVARIRLRRAELLEDLEYYAQALESYEQLSRDLQHSRFDDVREVAADAALARARLLKKQESPAAAQVLDELIATYAGSQHTGIRQTLALAQVDRIHRLQEEGNWPLAVAACEQMEALASDSDSATEVRSLGRCLQVHVDTLYQMLDEAGDDDPAEEWAAQANALSEQHWQRHALYPNAQVRNLALGAWINACERMDGQEALDAYEQALQKLGDDDAPELQAALARAWINKLNTEAQVRGAAETLPGIAAMEQRFAASEDATAQVLLARAQRLKARLHHHLGDQPAALAALQALAERPEPEDMSEGLQGTWHRQIAEAMNLEAEIWAKQSPPAHENPSGRDANGELIEPPAISDAERQHAGVAKRMLQRFGDDPDPRVRALVLEVFYNLAVSQRDRLHFEESIETYQTALQKFASDPGEALAQNVAGCYLNLAYVQMQLLRRNEEALKTYDALIAHFGSSTRPIARDTVARANASRLTCLNRLQSQGVEVNYGDQYEAMTAEQLKALRRLQDDGTQLQKKEQYREAIASYDQIIEPHLQSLHPELRALCLDALVNKGFCLGRLGQREAALAVNNEVIERYSGDMNLSFEKDVALALANKAVQLDKLGRPDEEIAVYDEIIRRWRGNSLSYLRMRVARAMWSKAFTLAERDVQAAEALYRQTIDRYLPATEPEVRLEAAKACVSLGSLLRKQGRYEEAAAGLEMQLQTLDKDNAPGFAEQVNWLRLQLARNYGKTGQSEPQLAMYQRLLALPEGELNSQQLKAAQEEYQACKPPEGLQALRQKAASAILGMFGKR